MNRKIVTLLLTLACTANIVQAQVYNEMDVDGNITQRNEYGQANFNPNRNDSTNAGNKEIPIGVRSWTIDRRFGDVIPTDVDTISHLYQNSIYNTGLYGEYNTTGNNYTARLSRIFIDRKPFNEFYFVQPYSFTTKDPDQFLFINTLSPFTNISYEECGNKQHGEDHLQAKFGINAGKKLGVGFDLDYHYALGYFDNQSTSHFRASLFSSYIGDHYQMHLLASAYHRKATENGGIINDNYITHPESVSEQFSEEEIPTVLSSNWNRNNSQHLFFSHRYNLGFYRKVKMTDEEIKARKFAQKSAQQREKEKEDSDRRNGVVPQNDVPSGRPADAKIMGDEPVINKSDILADSTRIKVDSQEKLDSLKREQAIQDSIEATMKHEFVPVTSIIHTLDLNNYSRIYQAYQTPTNYYADTFYDLNDENVYSGDSIYDQNKFMSVKNTLAIALLEGFNKYMKAGMKVFVSHEYCNYRMPDLMGDSTAYYMKRVTENAVNVGGQISRRQGHAFHFDLTGEFCVVGPGAGNIGIDFGTDLNFPLFGDTVRLAANATFKRLVPTYYQEHYHSKHLWWDKSLDAQTNTHIEGRFSYDKTNTLLRIAIDEVQNYTYFGMKYNVDATSYNRSGLTGSIYQEGGNINILTAQLMQNLRYGIINWENVLTYQNSSNKDVLPLPTLNVFTNLYLKFKIARVLSVELGSCMTFFTKYYAPDYLPQLGQFAIQQNEDSRVELGGYPFVDVYANMHLKRARFFVSYSHVNAGAGTKNQFLTPHYPTNSAILHAGVSWNFFN
jgi:hypothetical protein